ncbi:MAG: hypothetical protein HYY57_01170 [Candidatus Omnitrophica bacterium]|nr:hypothetical protein [Candidatus Omnitrophota bacterium]
MTEILAEVAKTTTHDTRHTTREERTQDSRLTTHEGLRESRVVSRESKLRESWVVSRESKPNRGTALLETAIFGMVALAAIGFMLRVGLMGNYAQEVRMGSFRRCLSAAFQDDNTFDDAVGTIGHYVLNRRLPNPTDRFMLMPRARTEASCFATVGTRLTFANMDGAGFGIGQPQVIAYSDGNFAQFPYGPYIPHGGWFVRNGSTTNTGGGRQWQERTTGSPIIRTHMDSNSGMGSSTGLGPFGTGSGLSGERSLDWDWTGP